MPRAPPVMIAVLPSSFLPSSLPIALSHALRQTAAALKCQARHRANRTRDISIRAVGYKHSLPIDQAEALIDLTIDKPAPGGRDLLVQVKAVSVNPVDTKVRLRADPKGGAPKILGYDASGIVAAVGPDATLFRV